MAAAVLLEQWQRGDSHVGRRALREHRSSALRGGFAVRLHASRHPSPEVPAMHATCLGSEEYVGRKEENAAVIFAPVSTRQGSLARSLSICNACARWAARIAVPLICAALSRRPTRALWPPLLSRTLHP